MQADALTNGANIQSPERHARPGVPCLVRHRMRRTVLPFPEPRVPDGLPGQRPLARARSRNPCDWSEALPAVRSNPNSHSSAFTLTPFAGALRGAIPARTSALAVGPRLRHSGSTTGRTGRLRSLGLHGGPDLRQATGMGTRSFHDVTVAYPLPGPCPRCVTPNQRAGMGQRLLLTRPSLGLFQRSIRKRGREFLCPV